MVFITVAIKILLRPALWWTAVKQIARMTPSRWWAQAPFLPIPRSDYIEFRLVTQYGGSLETARSKVEPADVLNYLQWCKQWDRHS